MTSQETRVEQFSKVQKEGLELFKRKNADYGDAFANYGPIGVLVRMGDKIQRLSNITKKGVTMVNDESLRDTLIDLHNYSAMAIMLLDEDKKQIYSLIDDILTFKQEFPEDTTKNPTVALEKLFFKESDRGRSYLSEGRSDDEILETELEWMAFKQA